MRPFSRTGKYADDGTGEQLMLVDKLLKEGRKITKLNQGDPAIYFPPSKYLIDSFIEALKEGKVNYSHVFGLPELREAVAKRYERKYGISVGKEDVAITNGVSEAFTSVASALLDPGDSAVIFSPYYSLYRSNIKVRGGVPIEERCNEADGWSIDTEHLERTVKRDFKGKRKIKYMLMTTPNNPTGTVLSEKTMKEIVEIAKNYNILLISDEIYDEIVFNGAKFTSLAKLAKGIPHVIYNGASKDFDVPGIRLGFMVMPGQDKVSTELKRLMHGFGRLKISANTPAQYAIASAMNNEADHDRTVRSMTAEIEKRANLATKLINEGGYMHSVQPKGAFYMLPKLDMGMLEVKNDNDFANKLLMEEGVFVTPGHGFGAKNHIRIVTLATEDILEVAINKINKFCERHSK